MLFCNTWETGNKDVMPIISILLAYLWKKEKYIVFHSIEASTALEFKCFIDQIRFESLPKEHYTTVAIPLYNISPAPLKAIKQVMNSNSKLNNLIEKKQIPSSP